MRWTVLVHGYRGSNLLHRPKCGTEMEIVRYLQWDNATVVRYAGQDRGPLV